MTQFRKELIDLIRPLLKAPVTQAFVTAFDAILDSAGVPRDEEPESVAPPPRQPAAPLSPPAAPQPPQPAAGRLDIAGLRAFLGLPAGGAFDEPARIALFRRLANRDAPALTDADFGRAADQLGVSPKIIRAVRKVEAPRGPFDEIGRPTILYEKHVFSRQTAHRFDGTDPILSARNQKPTSYGKFSVQYPKLASACALDPDAAFMACSWGAFQILGENAVSLGYRSAFDMALALTVSEAAHLDSFVRFVRVNDLVGKLQACRAGDAASCIPFVKQYNGPGFADNAYHIKLARAAL